MHPNHTFLLSRSSGRVLDFGCGRGEFVDMALRQGVDCFGADVFQSSGRREAESSGKLGTIIHEITNGHLPFPDAHFDTVVSNYVFEHVENLAAALDEIHRVLKPGGKLIALFPTIGAWREGHLDLPFIHWFPPGRTRYAYTLALRRMGLGEKVGSKPPDVWTRSKLKFVDTCTFYRSRHEMGALLKQRFSVHFIEDEFVSFRLGNRRWASRLATATGVRHGTRLMARLSACTAIEATRTSDWQGRETGQA